MSFLTSNPVLTFVYLALGGTLAVYLGSWVTETVLARLRGDTGDAPE